MSFAKSVFFTYLMGTPAITGGTSQVYEINKSYGHAPAIHCNYVQKLETDSIINKTINVILPDGSLFPFLRESLEIDSGENGYGWCADKLFGIAQIVDGTGTTAIPDPNQWKILDLTDQLDGYQFFSGTTIPKAAFNTASVIKIGVQEIYDAAQYTLDYLNYPSALDVDDEKLAFGEEAFFFGNVRSEIQAIAYTTDISIVLPLNQYNSTTNKTWDSMSPVQICEVGVFDNNDNLVAIGKINNPIAKDATIFRTVQFSLDF